MTAYLYLIVIILVAILFVFEMRRSLKRSNITNQLIHDYIDHLQDKSLLDKIYTYCTTDYKLRRIMARHHATREDLEAIYQKLLIWGNFKKGRRFVPISSFFFTTSLEYLLKHKDDDAKKITMRMMNFFHI